MSGQILNPITVEPGPAKRSAMGAGIEGGFTSPPDETVFDVDTQVTA